MRSPPTPSATASMSATRSRDGPTSVARLTADGPPTQPSPWLLAPLARATSTRSPSRDVKAGAGRCAIPQDHKPNPFSIQRYAALAGGRRYNAAVTTTPDRHGPGDSGGPLVLRVGRDELVIRQRYETLSIVNDLLIGTWFLIGSFFFFSSSLSYAGTWLFVVGSVEMLIRPLIRFTRRVHLQRYHPDVPGVGDGGHDF